MMINWINRTLKMAGAAAAFASMSFAADAFTANIEFPFSVKGASLAAGAYRVYPTRFAGGRLYVQMRNIETGKKVAIVPMLSSEAIRGENFRPRLVFNCAGEGCRLTQVWTGTGMYHEMEYTHRSRAPKVSTVLMNPGPGI